MSSLNCHYRLSKVKINKLYTEWYFMQNLRYNSLYYTFSIEKNNDLLTQYRTEI